MLVAMLKSSNGQGPVRLDPSKTYPADQIEWVPLGFRNLQPLMEEVVVDEHTIHDKKIVDAHYSNARQQFVVMRRFKPKPKVFSAAVLSKYNRPRSTDKRIIEREQFE